MIKKLLFTKPV